MAKELTFSSATLGWRFSHTDIFLKHFIKQWELLQDVQIKNLDEYWNIDEATGEWLKQLGAIFHVDKPQILSGNAFVLDIDMMDDDSIFLDGTNEDIADDLFRKIIILRSISTRKLFSMKNIADNIYAAFGQDEVKVEFRENTDINDQPKERYFRLMLTFRNSEMIKLFIGLQETFPLILIGKPMGVSYDIYVEHNPNLSPISFYAWRARFNGVDYFVYTKDEDPRAGDMLYDSDGQALGYTITRTWRESESQTSGEHYILCPPQNYVYYRYPAYDIVSSETTENTNGILCLQANNDAATKPVCLAYKGTDASIIDTSVCYSYDNRNYTGYIDKDITILANTWFPVYTTQAKEEICAYIKSPVDLPPLTLMYNYYTLLDNEVYFPLLGETEADARSCRIARSVIRWE